MITKSHYELHTRPGKCQIIEPGFRKICADFLTINMIGQVSQHQLTHIFVDHELWHPLKVDMHSLGNQEVGILGNQGDILAIEHIGSVHKAFSIVFGDHGKALHPIRQCARHDKVPLALKMAILNKFDLHKRVLIRGFAVEAVKGDIEAEIAGKQVGHVEQTFETVLSLAREIYIERKLAPQ